MTLTEPTITSVDWSYRRSGFFDKTTLASYVFGPQTGYTQPVGSTAFTNGATTATVQAALTAGANNAQFWFGPGVYRMTSSLTIKQGQELHGHKDSVIYGSKLLGTTTEGATVVLGSTTQANAGTHWALDGANARYYIGSQSAALDYPGTESQSGYRADRMQELFRNGVRLKHHDTLAHLATGGCYFDDGTGRWYMKDSPAGAKMTSSGNGLIYFSVLTASSIKLYNMTIKQYGNYAQEGAVRSFSANAIFENCEFSNNHGPGFTTNGNGSIARGCKSTLNGQLGWGASSATLAGGNDYTNYGNNILIEYCESSWNNDARYKEGWEAGGNKHSATTYLTVRRIWSHDNYGVGLWTDTNNYMTLFDEVLIEDTGSATTPGGLLGRTTEGITSEINYSTTIRNSLIRHVGKVATAGWGNGAGIMLSGSSDHDVYGNVVDDCARGIIGIDQGRTDGAPAPSQLMRFTTTPTSGVWHLARNRVHHNETYQPVATIDLNISTGFLQDNNATLFSANVGTWDNLYHDNKYFINTAAMPNAFTWNNTTMNFAAWQATGQDPGSTLAAYTAYVVPNPATWITARNDTTAPYEYSASPPTLPESLGPSSAYEIRAVIHFDSESTTQFGVSSATAIAAFTTVLSRRSL